MQAVSSGTLNGSAPDSHIVEGFPENTMVGDRGPARPDAVSISFRDNADAGSVARALRVNSPPRTPAEVILQWDKLTYEVESKADKMSTTRTILNEITGELRGGETIAIIGSSGAGKTTLLNALSGRIVGGQLSGQVLFYGAKRHPGSYKRVTSFVQQDDIMHPLLTVQETLTYAAKLRLPNKHYTAAQKSERVSTIIKQLRLSGVKDSRIGNANVRGVSGGERKRVSIGTELLTDPDLLFLDEPTSGLDSNSSQLVVELVKQIAREQQIGAMMTIHQPSARIFNTFDKVILLSQGHVVYFGPTASAIEYFASIGYHCPMHENPADYFIDLMTLDYRTDELLAESRSRVVGLAHSFLQHGAKHAGLSKSATGDTTETSSFESEISIDPRNTWFVEFRTLAHRDWTNMMRNYMFLVSQGFQSLVTALIVGFMFFYLKHDATSIQNRLGVLFVMVLNSTFPVVMPSMQAYVKERDIMLRERASAVYRVTTFFVSKAMSFIPLALLNGLVFVTGVYFISHLTFEVGKFFIALGVYACSNVVSIAFMLLIGSSVEDVEVAFVIGPAVLTLQLLFGGLLANPSTITPVLRWLRWVNPVSYAYAALIQNEFDGLEFECKPGSQCYSSGEQVIQTYSMGRFTVGENIGFQIMLAAVFFAAGYCMLRWKIKPKYIWI